MYFRSEVKRTNISELDSYLFSWAFRISVFKIQSHRRWQDTHEGAPRPGLSSINTCSRGFVLTCV